MKICRIFNFSTESYHHMNFREEHYKLEVICSGNIHSDGKIVDIKYIDLQTNIILKELLGYDLLNDIVENPTLENIISWIYYRLVDKLPNINLKLWIGDRTYVEWK